MITIEGKDLIALYLFLNGKELEDKRLKRLLDRIEKKLYEKLSIEQMENLERFYYDDKTTGLNE
ncbi:MAG: hypothetical protein DRP87_18430 [Spirochaetes bacterium]|nr:MAG: hypothetical protein DRP87_18430 [Spirochaetota bacterium]